ncbi:hypothetical protein Hanom_Chr14g01246821 [Helianthus anomalus]
MIKHSLKIFRGVASNRYKESKPPRKLIGALDKTDYVAPENDKWRHNDSQSDDEEPKLKKMMEDKFGRKKIKIFGDSTESDSDDNGDDEGNDGGDSGAAGASVAGTTGATSVGGDAEDSESGDNRPEPGYEFFLDDRGVGKVMKIRQEDDVDYVPSDTEVERLKRKQNVAHRKKKNMKYIGASSVQPTVSQPELVHEADMNPNFGLTTDEAAAIISSPPRSSEPTHVHGSERRQRKFSEMQQDEKVDFLFSQLQAAACQIDRQSAVTNVIRGDVIKHRLEMNTLKSTVERQQAEITREQAEIEQLKAENARLKAVDGERERQLQQMRAADNARGIDMNCLKERSIEVQRLAENLKAKHDDMKEWYNSRNTKIIDGVKRINDGFENVRKCVNILWADRCKQQESLKKRDHDSEDPGNPDPSATSDQPSATASTQIVSFEPPQIESTQGTSSGTIEEIQQLESSSYVESSFSGTSSVPSSADLALQAVHPCNWRSSRRRRDCC